jgi:hypothetical protein
MIPKSGFRFSEKIMPKQSKQQGRATRNYFVSRFQPSLIVAVSESTLRPTTSQFTIGRYSAPEPAGLEAVSTT